MFFILFLGNLKQLVRRAVQQQAKRFYVFVANGFGLVVDHAVEILITHAELFI